MSLPLLLPLLLLPAFLQNGSSIKCNSNAWYEVNQPKRLSAPEGGSIHIPFSFCHPWESASVLSVRITWRWKDFQGAFIYNTTPHFIHTDFQNRLSLNWTESWENGYLQISNLRKEDESLYFCRVYLTVRQHEEKMWQSVPGTRLTITQAPKKTTQVPSTTAAATTDGLSVSGGKKCSGSWSLSMEAVIGIALFTAVLKIVILGVMVYLRWKRSKEVVDVAQRLTGMFKRGLNQDEQ
ncbi:paired immunoglobulin-like type 2 receptor beta isoform 1-T1 [Hipposideros larvatus]